MTPVNEISGWLIENWERILPILAVLLAWWLNNIAVARTKLTFGRANNSFHSLPNENGEKIHIYCEKHYVQNTGTRVATGLEISFSNPPTELSTYPAVEIDSTEGSRGELIVKINKLGPKELLVIDTIHVNANTAEIQSVRSDQGAGKPVNFLVQRQFGRAMTFLVAGLMALGAYYGLFLLISFVSNALNVS